MRFCGTERSSAQFRDALWAVSDRFIVNLRRGTKYIPQLRSRVDEEILRNVIAIFHKKKNYEKITTKIASKNHS